MSVPRRGPADESDRRLSPALHPDLLQSSSQKCSSRPFPKYAIPFTPSSGIAYLFLTDKTDLLKTKLDAGLKVQK